MFCLHATIVCFDSYSVFDGAINDDDDDDDDDGDDADTYNTRSDDYLSVAPLGSQLLRSFLVSSAPNCTLQSLANNRVIVY